MTTLQHIETPGKAPSSRSLYRRALSNAKRSDHLMRTAYNFEWQCTPSCVDTTCSHFPQSPPPMHPSLYFWFYLTQTALEDLLAYDISAIRQESTLNESTRSYWFTITRHIMRENQAALREIDTSQYDPSMVDYIERCFHTYEMKTYQYHYTKDQFYVAETYPRYDFAQKSGDLIILWLAKQRILPELFQDFSILLAPHVDGKNMYPARVVTIFKIYLLHHLATFESHNILDPSMPLEWQNAILQESLIEHIQNQPYRPQEVEALCRRARPPFAERW